MFKINTIFVGKVLIKLKEIDSTINYLQQKINTEQCSEGIVIQASFQKHGIGQRGNAWESEAAKNLLVSILLRPTFIVPRHAFLLNIISSLAVRDTIQFFTKKIVSIKWPNDIWVEEKKIAGILVNNSLNSNAITSSIFGIGININQLFFSDQTKNATSLKLETNLEVNIDEVLSILCQKIEKRYLELKAGKIEALKTNYFQFLLGYKTKRFFRLPHSNDSFQGEIIDVNTAGQLILRHVDNTTHYYNHKEIIFLKNLRNKL